MNSAESKSDPSNRRRQTRYAVSDDCVLRSSLTLWSDSHESTGAPRKSWPGVLVDVSTTGAHVQVSLAAVASSGDSCILTLAYGTTKLELRGMVAHYVCAARRSVCGIKFDFSFGNSERAYHRVFDVLVASGSLAASSAGSSGPGQYREEFRGEKNSSLVVWRDRAGGMVTGFEFTMNRFVATLPESDATAAKPKDLIRFRALATGSGDLPSIISGSDLTDARWEFGVAASNLPQAVPADLRKYFRGLA